MRILVWVVLVLLVPVFADAADSGWQEIAYKKGYIDREQLIKLAEPILKSDYGQYLMQIANSNK